LAIMADLKLPSGFVRCLMMFDAFVAEADKSQKPLKWEGNSITGLAIRVGERWHRPSQKTLLLKAYKELTQIGSLHLIHQRRPSIVEILGPPLIEKWAELTGKQPTRRESREDQLTLHVRHLASMTTPDSRSAIVAEIATLPPAVRRRHDLPCISFHFPETEHTCNQAFLDPTAEVNNGDINNAPLAIFPPVDGRVAITIYARYGKLQTTVPAQMLETAPMESTRIGAPVTINRKQLQANGYYDRNGEIFYPKYGRDPETGRALKSNGEPQRPHGSKRLEKLASQLAAAQAEQPSQALDGLAKLISAELGRDSA
jgi:acyl-CoA-binding protein